MDLELSALLNRWLSIHSIRDFLQGSDTFSDGGGSWDFWACNGILNDKASQIRLKEARQVCRSYLQEQVAKKQHKVEMQCSNDIAKAGGLACLHGGGSLLVYASGPRAGGGIQQFLSYQDLGGPVWASPQTRPGSGQKGIQWDPVGIWDQVESLQIPCFDHVKAW